MWSFLNKLNRVTVTAKILEELILVEYFKRLNRVTVTAKLLEEIILVEYFKRLNRVTVTASGLEELILVDFFLNKLNRVTAIANGGWIRSWRR